MNVTAVMSWSCVSGTSLGRPVVPLVCTMMAGLDPRSRSTGRGGGGAVAVPPGPESTRIPSGAAAARRERPGPAPPPREQLRVAQLRAAVIGNRQLARLARRPPFEHVDQ